MYKVGIVDTTFARVDMAKYALEVIHANLPHTKVIRYTVPGIKDIPVAAKKLLDEEECEIAITFGWVGSTLTDKYSYLAMSIGLIFVQILTGKHIIDVTVHEDEAKTDKELYRIAMDRARKHAYNLIKILMHGKKALNPYAGMGLRQGTRDVGPIGEGYI